MTLSGQSRLVRWTYVLSPWPPDQTTLCAFFWRCFIWMPLFWLMVVCLSVSATVLIVWGSWQTRGLAPLAVFLLALLIWLWDRYDAASRQWAQRMEARIGQSVFVQGLRALKGKLCPLVFIQ